MKPSRLLRRAKAISSRAFSTKDHSSSISFSFNDISQVVEPKEFIRIIRNNRQSLKEAKFVAPKLGEDGFGKVIIKFK